MLEILKLVLPFLGGGAVGAILNEWFRRRNSKVQSVSLIERVNRSVSPELEGITLARVEGDPPNRRLEELRNLREFQLTLRNTSTVHLQNVEIQFEFPSEDVQAWASRPSLSKTALVLIDAVASKPWARAFRWRIPHLPSGDSVEFTFRAVNPPSGDYEVALYNSDRVIIERIVGEPAPKKMQFGSGMIIIVVCSIAVLVVALGYVSGFIVDPSGERLSSVKEDNCELRVISLFDRYGQGINSPWRIKHRIFNVGIHNCFIESAKLNPKGTFTIGPGEIFEREWITARPPRLTDVEVSVGDTNTTLKKTMFQVYTEQ